MSEIDNAEEGVTSEGGQPKTVVATPETAEAASVPSTPTDTGETNTPTGEESSTEETKPGRGVQKRIDELTRKRYQAEAQAEQLRRQNEELQLKLNPPAPPPEAPTRPDIAAYEGDYDRFASDLTQYAEDIAEFKAEAHARERDEAAKRANVEQQMVAGERERQVNWQANLNAHLEAPDTPEDFAQIALGNHWNPSWAMMREIMESPNGPQLAYHFGRDPAEAAKYKAMSDTQVTREIAKLSVTLSTSKAPKPNVSNAPTPVNPVSGGTEAPVEDVLSPNFSGDMDAYVKARRRQRAAKNS